MVGESDSEIDQVAFWKAKAEEWKKAAAEAKEELEEFQNESRYHQLVLKCFMA